MAFEKGTQVRMKQDPTAIGVCAGRVRTTGSRVLHAIDFAGTIRWEPDYHLEELKETPEHPLDLLEHGRLGRAADLRRVLTQVRLAGKLEDFIYSMEVSDTDFYAYQFKPVLKMLNSPANGILIADEVGLGKTIEAGLIWTELRSRYDLSRLMVLCPAMLQEKWQTELRKRFGVKADIVRAQEALDVLSGKTREGLEDSFAIIGSQQGLRPPRGWDDEEEPTEGPSAGLARLLEGKRGEEPLIDLLIIDEAHYLRNPETQTSKLGKLLRDVAEHVVLLSATPIHLRNRDLHSLLRLIDEDTYTHEAAFDDILEANRPLVRLRDLVLSPNPDVEQVRELIREAQGNRILYDNRQLAALAAVIPTQEDLAKPDVRAGIAHRVETMNLLSNEVTRTRKREVQELRVLREVKAIHLPLSPVEQRVYEAVTTAVREYCARRNTLEGFLLVTPQRQMASCMAAALETWEKGAGKVSLQLYEDLGLEKGEDEEDDRPLVSHLVEVASGLASAKELERNDSKFNALLGSLKQLFNESPGEKVVLFAYFKATLRYLHRRLTAEGIRSIILSGDSGREKGKILETFASESGPNVLLSSEVGSEGVDLQFSSIVVNYDLPWNPMKVEQRIGRVDRIGQKADKIAVWNLFYEGTIDQRIYERLFMRLGIFKFALGDLEEVLGDRIRELTADILSRNLTPEQERERIDQAATAIATIAHQEQQLEAESASLLAYGDYVLEKIHEARDLHRWISGADMFGFVKSVLSEKYQCEFKKLDSKKLLFNVRLSDVASHDLERFMRENRIRTTTKLSGLTSSTAKCLFENRITARGEGGVEVIGQTHPLVRFVSEVADELYANRHPAISARLARENLTDPLEPGDYVFVLQKWISDGLQRTERLHYAVSRAASGAPVLSQQEAERLINAAARHGSDWLEAKVEIDLPATAKAGFVCLDRADESYDQYVGEMDDQNQDRLETYVRGLEKHLQTQLAKLEETMAKLQAKGHMGLVSATEGRMKAVKERVRRKLAEADGRRKISTDKVEICAGIIRIE